MVERHLAKVNVASSNLVFRSISEQVMLVPIFLCKKYAPPKAFNFCGAYCNTIIFSEEDVRQIRRILLPNK